MNTEKTDLIQILSSLEQERFSGTMKVTASFSTSKKVCFFVFYKGALTLAERKLPSFEELLILLGRRLKIKLLDSMLRYTGQSQDRSIRAVLEAIISTNAVTWDDIERIMSQRMAVVIEQMLPYPCMTEPFPSRVEVSYGAKAEGISYTQILSLIEQRQKTWKTYLGVIPSVDAIPQVQPGVLTKLDHESTRNHLQKWVDGKASLADIAENLDQDPLTLAPLYNRWCNEGLITFQKEIAPARALPVLLSVDDSPIVQTMIRRVLTAKCEVVTVNSALAAMGILSHQTVSLILLDVTMPDIDGLEFCRTIRKIEKFKHLPIVMLTAKDTQVDRAMGLLAGTSRYLTKPVNPEDLLNTVKELIEV